MVSTSTIRAALPSTPVRVIVGGIALLALASPGLGGCGEGTGGSVVQSTTSSTGSSGGGGGTYSSSQSSTGADVCAMEGKSCSVAGDCCSGACNLGICGAVGDCAPSHASCDGTVPCCDSALCISGVCGGL